MRLELFDLNLLRALNALLEERNVSKAAQRLHVTQQAMSRSLRRLREHFDDKLLVRVGRELCLTPLGKALADPVREINLGIVAALETRSFFDPVLCERRFRIVMSDYSTLALLPRLMSELARTAPNIVCHVEPIGKEMLEDLLAGRVDFCVQPSESCVFPRHAGSPKEVHSLPLYADDFVCVIDQNHPEIGETMTWEQYLSASHNLLHLGSGAQSIVEVSWVAQRITPRVIATTGDFASLIWMIPGTSLVSTAQRRLAICFRTFLPIRIVECPVPINPVKVALQWHMRNDGDPAHLFMRKALVTAAATMDA